MKRTRFLGILLTLSLVSSIINSINVFASDLNNNAIKTETVDTTTTNETSRTTTVNTKATSFGPGDHYWGGVTFTGDNSGAYKTINGTQVKIKVAFKAVDSSPYSYRLLLDFSQYGGKLMYHGDFNSWTVSPDNDGYYYYETDWINIKSGVDYRFIYNANTSCACYDPRRVNVHIWVEVR